MRHFNAKSPSYVATIGRLLCSLILAFFALFAVTGCGGGGGDGGVPPDQFSTIGTVTFNHSTSRNLDGLETAFPVPSSWAWTWYDPAGPSWALHQNFQADTLYIPSSGLMLPVWRTISSPVATGSGKPHVYAFWAVAIDGDLYSLTAGPSGALDTSTTHVLVAQPRVVARKFMSNWWTDGVPGNLHGNNSATAPRTIVGSGVTSPAGFTQCLRIRMILTADPNNIEFIDEYWKDGYGLVEQQSTLVGGAIGDRFVRQVIAFSG